MCCPETTLEWTEASPAEPFCCNWPFRELNMRRSCDGSFEDDLVFYTEHGLHLK